MDTDPVPLRQIMADLERDVAELGLRAAICLWMQNPRPDVPRIAADAFPDAADLRG